MNPMRIQRLPSVVLSLTLAASPSLSLAQGDRPPSHSGSVMEFLRYEPTGLSLLKPYARGKIPVLFIHGLWSSPASWHRMIATLEEVPAIREKHQFWTFGYSTGDPIPYSAYLLRKNLDDVRRKFDPDRSDAAFDRMVIVGHSMGGLLSKMMAANAGDHLWHVVSDRPFGELLGEKADIDIFRNGLFFSARPEVRRVIYIATPHRGSHLDRGPIQHLGTRLVRIADPLREALRTPDTVAQRSDITFRDHFRAGLSEQYRRTGVGFADPDRPVRAAHRHQGQSPFHHRSATSTTPSDRDGRLAATSTAHVDRRGIREGSS